MVRLSFLTAALLALNTASADVNSGLAVGDSVRAFNPQHVTGPDAGKSACLVCANGEKPVVAIFAREIDDNLAALIKRVDEATAKNKKVEMGSFVIFLNKSDEIENTVKAFGDKIGVKQTVLALDNPAGPKGYNIAREADVTVLLYVGRKVKANFAFEKGKLTSADVEKVMKALPKILSE